MKVLSIKQPWASLIAHEIKNIENRSWKTNFRGRILIHASAATVFDAFMPNISGVTTVDQWLNENGYDWNYNNIPHSAIIGEVDIVDCVINHESIWAEKMTTHPSEDIKGMEIIQLGQKYIWNWVLANPVLYDTPILNVKGKLSFWEYELPDHFHLPVMGGHATFNSPPDKEAMDAVKKMAGLAWNIHTKKH